MREKEREREREREVVVNYNNVLSKKEKKTR